ncbi:MAG: hypothetical protein HY054_14770 [Proteobacteria bacterium]|nr:hypothetical protein [Pseudomonadota bacterium]
MLLLLAFFLAVASAPFASGAETAKPALSITLGETVVVRVDADGTVTELSRGPTQGLTDLEVQNARNITSGAYGDATGQNYVVAGDDPAHPLPAIQPDTLKITFVRIESDRIVALVIENGYHQLLTYHATLHQGFHSAPTDVCQVHPDLRGYETWPYLIDSIDLDGFALSDWTEGQRLNCQ